MPRLSIEGAATGSKKVRVKSTGKKGQVTIVACGNASGQSLPSMLIFDAKNYAMDGHEKKCRAPVMTSVIRHGQI